MPTETFSSSGGGESDMDEEATVDDGNTDPSTNERVKKKQQNSVRWKRWWLKNREAYNEKRRLSAQLRSAKNRASKEKSSPQQQAMDGGAASSSGRTLPPAKRVKRLKQETPEVAQQVALLANTAVSTTPPVASFQTCLIANNAGMDPMFRPTISPAHSLRSMMPFLPRMLTSFNPAFPVIIPGSMDAGEWKARGPSGPLSSMFQASQLPPYMLPQAPMTSNSLDTYLAWQNSSHMFNSQQ